MNHQKKNDLSIIIPCFNSMAYIEETLDSVFNLATAEYQLEVLLIDDASTDQTVETIKAYLSLNSHPNIRVELFENEINRGQGYNRNKGVELATGAHILFLDSDDLLMKYTVVKCLNELRKDESLDAVLFEWAYYHPENRKTVYVNSEKYQQYEVLKNEECELLLNASTYFTVNKVYKKEFLLNCELRFGEGYLYEDFEFYVRFATCANKIKLIPNILYKVRVHETSATKTNNDTLIHRDSFLRAIEKTSSEAIFRSQYGQYQVFKYFIHRSLIYAEKRLPNNKKLRRGMILSTVKIINSYSENLELPKKLVPLYHFLFTEKLIEKEKIGEIEKIYKMHKNGNLKPYLRVYNFKKRIKSIAYNRLFKKFRSNIDRTGETGASNLGNLDGSGKILMLGFDYGLKGNSKYLFEQLMNEFDSDQLKIVTRDPAVPIEYRIVPRSKEFFERLATSQFLISESWIPLAFRKSEGQTWIQLWHGTPYKKLLFDSNEKDLIVRNPAHKTKLKQDIERWDFLLSDSPIATEKFQTAFDVEETKLLEVGYPRNEWLVLNQGNQKLKDSILEKIGIQKGMKNILYVPTWRDYNYGKNAELQTQDYLLDLTQVHAFLLEEGYNLIYKDHALSSLRQDHSDHIIHVDGSVDIQELLLIADIVISDYSSAIFDAFYLGTPVYLLEKDYTRYRATRGVYEDMRFDMRDIIASSESRLLELIRDQVKLPEEITSKFVTKDILGSSHHIAQLMIDLRSKKKKELDVVEEMI